MIPIRFSAEHIWIKLDDDGSAFVGISDYAQDQLGDIVFVEAPDVGREISNSEEIGFIESVKTNSELHAPASGRVVEVNETIAERPELINESPLDDGWIFRMVLDDESEIEDLMDENDYSDFVDSLE